MPYCLVVKFRRIRDCSEEAVSGVHSEPPMNWRLIASGSEFLMLTVMSRGTPLMTLTPRMSADGIFASTVTSRGEEVVGSSISCSTP